MKYEGFIWAGLLVEDLENAVSFYREVIGLPLLGEGKEWAHLNAGNGAMFELMTGGKASDKPKGSDDQPIILGLRVANLDNPIKELKQKNVNFISEVGEFEDTRWIHFADPEGNRLEIKEVPINHPK